jgi:hypothetical protein
VKATAPVSLPQQRADGLGSLPAKRKSGNDLLLEKTFKDEPVMAKCFPEVSYLRGCWFGHLGILAGIIFYSELFVNHPGFQG